MSSKDHAEVFNAIKAAYPGVRFGLRNSVISDWPDDAGPKPVEADAVAEYRTKIVAGRPKNQSLAVIEDEKLRRINIVADDKEQSFLTARGLVLQDKGRGEWTAEEKAEWDANVAKWDRILAIRNSATTLATSLDGMKNVDANDFNACDESHWPEAPE